LLLRLRTALLSTFTARRCICLAHTIVPVFEGSNYLIVGHATARMPNTFSKCAMHRFSKEMTLNGKALLT
jgi:hypothetical protein